MSDEFVPIYTANGRADAQLIVMLLESAGIPAQMDQESYGHTLGLTVGSLGEVEILVPIALVAEAERLLEAYQRGDLEKDATDEELE